MKNLAVLTSGGDAPGMNAAIRAVVRTCIYFNVGVYGVEGGYQGLMENKIRKLHVRSVSRILGSGGTLLKSSRSPEFRTAEGRKKAAGNLKAKNIDGVVVIGGDGSLTGAHLLQQESGLHVIGIPGTIDNDLSGTENTIGFDSATNVVTESVDKIRDTASSHNRLFFVEVMGRDTGFIALRTAVATGAICVMLPEKSTSVSELIAILRKGYQNNKTSSIVIVAEGNPNGGAFELARKVNDNYTDYETKVTVLGHLQRGGDPSCYDRVLASQLGVGAVEGLLSDKSDCMVGLMGGDVIYTPIEKALRQERKIDDNLFKISQILSI
ncbi:MAG: 6-phosphofructokinase [Bacteroidetes bacterium]|jgi:6-phosphofructokinase 1|nr:6-phosphofructokinase [Bacteroidota bacterium]